MEIVRRQETEDRRQKTEDRRQKTGATGLRQGYGELRPARRALRKAGSWKLAKKRGPGARLPGLLRNSVF
jgi:hypothetical protein